MKNQKVINAVKMAVFGLVVIVFSSCSKTPENMKVIPNGTTFVTIIDIQSIVKKGKLSDFSEHNVYRSLKKEIRNENQKVSRLIDNFLEDHRLAGIDFTSDIFLYYVNEAKDERFLCLSAALKNEKKFTEFIEDLLTKLEIEFYIEKEPKYKYIAVDRDLIIGWDNFKLILLTQENYRSRDNLAIGIETLFNLKEREQITANMKFNKFYQNRKDINVWLSTNLFEESRFFRNGENNFDIDFYDNVVSFYLEFGQNEISISTNFETNKNIQKLLAKSKIWKKDFNGQLLKLFPMQHFAVAGGSVNPISFYNILKKHSDFDEIGSDFKSETDLEFRDLFEGFKGNFVFSLFNIDEIEYTYMDWGYGFNENSAVKQEMRFSIESAGELTENEIELLNNGKTIQCRLYSEEYCFNIKNVLEAGGDVESAQENREPINWFKGGWELGQHIERTKREILPLVSFAFDINNKKVFESLIEIIPAEELTKRNGYYEFRIYDRYPAYFLINNKIGFFTNDETAIKTIENSGHFSNSLANSDIKDKMSTSSFYTLIDLNIEDYPAGFRNQIDKDAIDEEKELINIWDEFAKAIEIKLINENSIQIVFKTREFDTNSLNALLTLVDDNYEFLMSI